MNAQITKIKVSVQGKEVELWQDKGIVFKQVVGEDKVELERFGNTQQGRLEAGAFLNGITVGFKMNG